jgi:hypothetical protein
VNSASWPISFVPARRADPSASAAISTKRACALGAVYDAVYHLPRPHGKLIPDHLERLFRCLDEVTKRCPQDGCKKRLPLAPMLVHLNDDHVWTREQIADWLTAESQ